MSGNPEMNDTKLGHTVIRRSVSKILKAAAVSVVFLGISMWLIYGGPGQSGDGEALFWGWIGVVYCGFVLIGIIRGLISGHRTPVELSPQGFWAKHSVVQEVPWSDVSRISVWSYGRINSLRAHFLRVQLTEEAFQRTEFTRLGRRTWRAHKPIGLEGIYIVSGGVDISFNELKSLFQKYLSQYNPTAIDDTE